MVSIIIKTMCAIITLPIRHTFFESTIITIIIGALSFNTALGWNSYTQNTFEHFNNEAGEFIYEQQYKIDI